MIRRQKFCEHHKCTHLKRCSEILSKWSHKSLQTIEIRKLRGENDLIQKGHHVRRVFPQRWGRHNDVLSEVVQVRVILIDVVRSWDATSSTDYCAYSKRSPKSNTQLLKENQSFKSNQKEATWIHASTIHNLPGFANFWTHKWIHYGLSLAMQKRAHEVPS